MGESISRDEGDDALEIPLPTVVLDESPECADGEPGFEILLQFDPPANLHQITISY
jgi:hypothetical protein